MKKFYVMSIIVFTVTVALTFFLIGCDTGNGNYEDGPIGSGIIFSDGRLTITNATITNIGAIQSGTVTMVNDNESHVKIADVGSIANGRLSLTLPKDLPDTALPFLDTASSGGGVTVFPNGITHLHRYTLYVYSGETVIGTLSMENDSGDTLVFWFFDNPVSITGMGYAINATRGWNKVFLGDNPPTTNMSIVPSNVRWHFMDE